MFCVKVPCPRGLIGADDYPHPIIIPKVMAISTLADARVLVERHLPAHYQAKETWRYVSKLLVAAAQGEADAREVEMPRERFRCRGWPSRSSAEVATTGMVSICARSKISARVNQIVC